MVFGQNQEIDPELKEMQEHMERAFESFSKMLDGTMLYYSDSLEYRGQTPFDGFFSEEWEEIPFEEVPMDQMFDMMEKQMEFFQSEGFTEMENFFKNWMENIEFPEEWEEAPKKEEKPAPAPKKKKKRKKTSI